MRLMIGGECKRTHSNLCLKQRSLWPLLLLFTFFFNKEFFMALLSRVALACLLASSSVHAANLSGDIVAGKLTWRNATVTEGGMAPHGWSTVLPESVVAWQPSVPSAVTPILTMNQQGGSKTVAIPVDVVGVQYHLNKNGTDGAPFFTGGAQKKGANTWVATGSGKGAHFYSKTVNYAEARTPFTAFKPIIKFENIDTLFQGKPGGVYVGDLSLNLPFVFKRAGTEQVTYNTLPFTVPVQITHRVVTCSIPKEQAAAREVNLGIIGVDDIVNGAAYSTKVPLQLNCDSSVSFGQVTFGGVDANVPNKAVVQANKRDDLGVELTPIKYLPRIELNKPMDYNRIFPSNIKNYDFSFNAKPVATKPTVAVGKYDANLTVNVTYQ